MFTDEFSQAVLDRYYLINDGKLYIAADEDKISSPFIITNVSVQKAEQGDGQYIASYDLVRNYGESLSLQSTFILDSKTIEQGTNGQVTYVDVPKISHIDFLSDAQTVASAHEASGQADAPTAEALTALFERCESVLMTYQTQGAEDGFKLDFPGLLDSDERAICSSRRLRLCENGSRLSNSSRINIQEIFSGDQLNKFLDTFFYNDDGKLCILLNGMSSFGYDNPSFMYLGSKGDELYYMCLCRYMESYPESVAYYDSNNLMVVIKEEDGYKVCNDDFLWLISF